MSKKSKRVWIVRDQENGDEPNVDMLFFDKPKLFKGTWCSKSTICYPLHELRAGKKMKIVRHVIERA